MPARTLVCALTLALAVALQGCASQRGPLHGLDGADVVLLGERHDDPAHHRTHAEVVRALAAQQRLAALAIEMADRGTTTAGLPTSADEQQVRAALQWNEEGWPWRAYGPAIMAAVQAGVPVLGANLPRSRMRAAMADASLDDTLDDAARAAQREAVRVGHCDMLPVQQLAPMVRVQVARDREMAQTVRAAAVAGKTVVLLAGAGHVDPQLGVPRHLPASLKVRAITLERSASAPQKDYCEEMRRHMQRRG
jgi:uncharacterized iron-regulated protein